jgi:hypothetical protein
LGFNASTAKAAAENARAARGEEQADISQDTPPTSTNAGKAKTSTSHSSTWGDENIKRYLVEVASTPNSLLALAQKDTNEAGTQRGNRIDFHADPIARGHFDSFSITLNADGSQSWACYSASNGSGFSGGSLLEYLLATGRANDRKSAVRFLLDATGHQKQQTSTTTTTNQSNTTTTDNSAAPKPEPQLALPRWEYVRASNPPKRRPCVIDGVLRRGHVGLFSGKAKAGKSWLGLQLCVAIACGRPWLGFTVERGNVLFIDPELDPRSLDQRFHKVCEAMDVDASEADKHILRWGLRGVRKVDGTAPTLSDVCHDLRELQAFDMLPKLDLIFVDSMAAVMTGDENSSRDVRANFNTLLEVAELTGAAVMCSHHQGKGQSGDRDAADRARGSSAFMDCPDVVMTLDEITPTSGNAGDFLPAGARALCLTCAGIREFASFADVHLIYQYPTHAIDVDGITEGWKPPSGRREGGRASAELSKANARTDAARAQAAILAHLYHHNISDPEGLPRTEAEHIAGAALGKETIPNSTLSRYLKDSPWLTIWKKSERKAYVCPIRLAPKPKGADADGQSQADISLLDFEGEG